MSLSVLVLALQAELYVLLLLFLLLSELCEITW